MQYAVAWELANYARGSGNDQADTLTSEQGPVRAKDEA